MVHPRRKEPRNVESQKINYFPKIEIGPGPWMGQAKVQHPGRPNNLCHEKKKFLRRKTRVTFFRHSGNPECDTTILLPNKRWAGMSPARRRLIRLIWPAASWCMIVIVHVISIASIETFVCAWCRALVESMWNGLQTTPQSFRHNSQMSRSTENIPNEQRKTLTELALPDSHSSSRMAMSWDACHTWAPLLMFMPSNYEFEWDTVCQ